MTNPTPDTPTPADPLEAAIEAAWRTAEDMGVIVGDGHTVRINRDGIAAAVRAAAPILLAPVERERDEVWADAERVVWLALALYGEGELLAAEAENADLRARLAAASDAHHEGFGEGVTWSSESWERTLAKLRADAERDALLRAADAANQFDGELRAWAYREEIAAWLRERAKAVGDD